MPRSKLALAALATVAWPGSSAVGVRGITVPGDYDAAEVTFSDGTVLVAKTPNSHLAGVSQAAELTLLDELRHLVAEDRLPFQVPEVVASAPLPDGGRIVLTKPVVGQPLAVDTLPAGLGLASAVGKSLAAIHGLPTTLLERLEFPIYSAAEYRDRHLAELEAAGSTGLVPPVLLSRWESFLDDDELWQFEPVVLHGDLAAEYLLVDPGRVATITDWGNARVADPADDLTWLVAAAPEAASDSILKAYQQARGGAADPGLVDRTVLLSELALTRWLQYGLREKRPDVVADATAMLSELASAIN